jgi:shikimate kinase
MKIYLIGYMGSGKTRFGKSLSVRTGYPFIDLDALFEERYKITVFDFFEKYNEESFRKIERELLLETLTYPDSIIATGGGTPCFFDNMEVIKKNGISIYLKLELIALVNRLASVRKKRPLLKDKSPEELETFIRQQIAEREVFYCQADYTVHVGKNDLETVIALLPELS